MRVIKSLCLFGGLAWMISACFESPEYPNTPKIAFEGVSFREVNGTDSLTLSLSFQDGDGDLGLDANDPRYQAAPYNSYTYAIKNGSPGGFDKGIVPFRIADDDTQALGLDRIDFIRPTTQSQGILLTDKALDDPAYYATMPANIYPNTCTTYHFDSVYVLESDNLIDETFTVKRRIAVQGDNLLKIEGRFVVERNPTSFNIQVDFEYLKKTDQNPNGEWTTYDWTRDSEAKTCAPSFNGRFPVLTQDDGSLDGVIRYHMASEGFVGIFGMSTQIRLTIRIRDRALNESNTIVTPPFTLAEIRR
jgi:hypothetical protein